MKLMNLAGVAVIALAGAVNLFFVARAQESRKPTDGRIEVVVRGGYATDPRDHGRPVALIAAALGVKDEIFRQAFSHVRPAAAGHEPEPAQVRSNKEALLRALGPYGIANDRLDEVSDYYRYNASRGNLWRHTPARAVATVRGGEVTDIAITNPGSSYCSTPTIFVPGFEGLQTSVKLGFGKDFKMNGSIESILIGRENAR